MRKLKQIKAVLTFDPDGKAVIESPKRSVPIGIRTKIGWGLVCIGMWVVFGRRKDFRSVVYSGGAKDV